MEHCVCACSSGTHPLVARDVARQNSIVTEQNQQSQNNNVAAAAAAAYDVEEQTE